MKPWKTTREDLVFEAPPYLKVVKQCVELPDGALIDDFYQVHLRRFAIVVPLLPSGQVLTLRQYRHGLGRVALGFPSGFLDDGEAPEAAVRRELLEETGYEAGPMTHLGEFVDNGNQRGCVGNYYVAHDCIPKMEADPGDLGEMVIGFLSAKDIDRALMTGEIGVIHHASVWAMARMVGAIPKP